MKNYQILPAGITALAAAQAARRNGLGLFITRSGRTVLAPRALPGWVRVGVLRRAAA